jgi:predicted esterase
MTDIRENQPFLNYAHQAVDEAVKAFLQEGLARHEIVLMGYSQGACLTADYAFNNPARYKAILCFTGGLIGQEGTTWEPHGSFGQCPVFISTSHTNEWVPASRVAETSRIFRAMDADVQEVIYKNRPHEISEDEIVRVQLLLNHLLP